MIRPATGRQSIHTPVPNVALEQLLDASCDHTLEIVGDPAQIPEPEPNKMSWYPGHWSATHAPYGPGEGAVVSRDRPPDM